MTTVGMISLGCAKNLVNSEQMLWRLRQAGYVLRSALSGCDAVVVNTCGFIESAKQEAIDQILELGLLKKEGGLKKIIVAGCLAERYRDEIFAELPEADALVGCGGFARIAEAVEQALAGCRPALFGPPEDDSMDAPRLISTPPATAYLKVAEGCDNRCAYCIIPFLRGAYRSRPMESVVAEARALAESGAGELILVAQDLTRYGLDLYGALRLPALLRALARIEPLRWIRLHYLYPDLITDELIDTVAGESKVVKYLDIPIQHSGDALLSAMNRRGTGAELERMVTALRERIPGVVLRTALIVGLPGETEDDFEGLCAFLRRTRWERAGVFVYSREEGTPAAAMPDQIEEDVKHRRRNLVMELQREIMEEYAQTLVGQTLDVLTEGYDRDSGFFYGRGCADSPDVDGKVFFSAAKKPSPGDWVTVCVDDVLDGDPFGRLV